MNLIYAFLIGGTICLIGQLLMDLVHLLPIHVTILFVLVGSILEPFGIYDKLGQIGKCGLVIPITGFANSMASSAMEYKPEGFILGVGANTFKLAGTVVVFGVFSAFVVAAIKYMVWLI